MREGVKHRHVVALATLARMWIGAQSGAAHGAVRNPGHDYMFVYGKAKVPC